MPIICTVRFGAAMSLAPGEDKDVFLERARAAVIRLEPLMNLTLNETFLAVFCTLAILSAVATGVGQWAAHHTIDAASAVPPGRPQFAHPRLVVGAGRLHDRLRAGPDGPAGGIRAGVVLRAARVRVADPDQVVRPLGAGRWRSTW